MTTILKRDKRQTDGWGGWYQNGTLSDGRVVRISVARGKPLPKRYGNKCWEWVAYVTFYREGKQEYRYCSMVGKKVGFKNLVECALDMEESQAAKKGQSSCVG